MSNVFPPNSSVHQQANTAGVAGPSSSRSTPPMPKYMRLDEWPFPYPLSTLLQYIFTGLCILAYGHTTLENAWNTAIEDGEMWARKKMLMATRLNQNNVTGGLFLATLAGWLTSSPPAGMILEYTARGSYICLFMSFVLIWGSIIVGSAVLYVIPMATGTWYRMTLMRTRSCVCGTLLTVTYPFLSMAAGTTTAILGFLLAAFNSQDQLIRGVAIFAVLLPTSLAWDFAWSQLSVLRRNKERRLADSTEQSEGLRTHSS